MTVKQSNAIFVIGFVLVAVLVYGFWFYAWHKADEIVNCTDYCWGASLDKGFNPDKCVCPR